MTSEKQSDLPPCVILCGGTSRRFGRNKMFADLAGKPLLAHTIDRVSGQVLPLALNGDIKDYGEFGYTVLPDAIDGKLGPLAGVVTAMIWGQELSQPYVLTVSGDAPFIPNDWAMRLIDAARQHPAVIIPHVIGQSHQVCALWPTGLANDLRAFLQDGKSFKVRDFLAMQNTVYVDFEMRDGLDPFFNVNTPDDLRKAEQILLA